MSNASTKPVFDTTPEATDQVVSFDSEELILVEGGKRRAGFPVEVQDELMFLYQLLLDQHRILNLRGQKITANRPPGTKFTMGNKD